MTKNEFERLRIFLRVHDPKVEDVHGYITLQDGSHLSIYSKDAKTLRIEGETLFGDFRFDATSSVDRRMIRSVDLSACPRSPFGYKLCSYF